MFERFSYAIEKNTRTLSGEWQQAKDLLHHAGKVIENLSSPDTPFPTWLQLTIQERQFRQYERFQGERLKDFLWRDRQDPWLLEMSGLHLADTPYYGPMDTHGFTPVVPRH